VYITHQTRVIAMTTGLLDNVPPSTEQPAYEPPSLVPIGNLNDLLASTGGSQCDLVITSSAEPDGTAC
jgi:hypothetical protein